MKTLKAVLFTVGFLFSISFVLAQSPLKVNSIEFKANYYKHKGLILDVRSADEYAAGHIEGSKNIDVENEAFESNIEKLDKNQAIFVYCTAGERSAIAANILRKNGFIVFDLNGGYPDLIKAGMKSTQ